MCVCVCVRVSGWSVKAVYLWLSGDCQTGCVVPPPHPTVDEEGRITVCSPGPAVAASDGEDLPMRCIFIRATS